jgi:hypothetical protein
MPLALGGSLSFMGWLATLVMAATRGFHADGRVRSTGWRWAIANLVLLAAWITLVRLA